MWKVNHFKNDNARLPERTVSYRFDSMEYEDMIAKQMFIELKSHILKISKFVWLAYYIITMF